MISVFVRDDIVISSRWPYVVFTDDCLTLIIGIAKWVYCFSDGDSEKVKCDNRADPAVPVAGAPAAGGVSGGARETGHYDRT